MTPACLTAAFRMARPSMSAVLALALGACAAPTAVTTNRALDYDGRPTRLYVIAGAGMGWGPDFSGAFRAKFREIAGRCGATTGFEEISGLELDQNGPAARAAAFGADTILTITHAGGVISGSTGNRLSISYGATLSDVSQHRAVWRGNFAFNRGGTVIPIEERGSVLAIDITNGLKKDGILPGCSQIALGQGGRLDPSAVAKPRPQDAKLPTQSARPSGAAPGTPSLKDLQGLLPSQ
ncbi:hypothetical protein BJN34_31005 [Cupriavidus necator]|uniref:Lipoprotein n=2 Tax=Cupriavidus necator TaxID=106590 RepID=A0A1U9V088_CUPNE|nr:hypothetical protein BJN34_31005 [Cupriavidus necator]